MNEDWYNSITLSNEDRKIRHELGIASWGFVLYHYLARFVRKIKLLDKKWLLCNVHTTKEYLLVGKNIYNLNRMM